MRCITQVRGTDENPDACEFSDNRHIINTFQAFTVHMGTALFACMIGVYSRQNKTHEQQPQPNIHNDEQKLNNALFKEESKVSLCSGTGS